MVRVRQATTDDARGIAKVHVASWQAAYVHALPAGYLASLSVQAREDRWRAVLADTTETVVVAEDRGVVVGFTSIAASRDEDARGDRVGELHTIYVHPDYWDTGTGSRLHAAAVQTLAASGFREAILWVLDSNHRARSFYERHGWAVDGELKREARGGKTIIEVRYRRAVAWRPVEPVPAAGGSRTQPSHADA